MKGLRKHSTTILLGLFAAAVALVIGYSMVEKREHERAMEEDAQVRLLRKKAA